MATQYKTPGVYIQEPSSFPPSIVGVETAVPCFIGYTEKAVELDGYDLHRVPRRINSMAEYVQIFGGAYLRKYYLAPDAVEELASQDRNWGQVSLDGLNSYTLVEAGSIRFNLYHSMRLFYANGGGPCYVISVGDYGSAVGKAALLEGVAECAGFIGPTMVAIPDAVLLSAGDAADVNVAMLQACRYLRDRMALIDIWGVEELTGNQWESAIADFRAGIRAAGPESLQFGAAYFPPLVTAVVAPEDIAVTSFVTDDADKLATLKLALRRALAAKYPAPEPAGDVALSEQDEQFYANYIDKIGTSVAPPLPRDKPDPATLTHPNLTTALAAMVPGFAQLRAAIAATQNVLPPSGAMAGVWTTNDATRGVWNAPANTGIAALIQPKLPITGAQQDDLNVPVDGLAVNAIRTFQGRGTLVWGARTLDSLSNDWRYIQVRRTVIYVEQSVKRALETMVFKPNTAQTWVTVTSMIESFLHNLWAAGGLMGPTPGEAYNVRTGLGSTMTADDVLNGVMRVQIMLQMVHPAEFITLSFDQQMMGDA